MTIDRGLEELKKELLSAGTVFFQESDSVRSLVGTNASEAVKVLARQMTDLTQGVSLAARVTPGISPASPTTGLGDALSSLAKGFGVNDGGSLSSLAGDLGKTSGNFLLKGLTLAPLVSGLLSLFRRDNATEEAAPIRFTLPAPLKTEAGLAPDGQMVSIDRGANDRVRPIRWPETGASETLASRAVSQARAAPLQNITVQVNAMDSRSFLDHSEDIARAVRDAMLHSHSLNDVVNDL